MDSTPRPLLKAEVIFKTLIWDDLVKAKIAALIVTWGVAWWPLGPVLTMVLIKFSDKIFEELKLALNLEAIHLKNVIHEHEYDKASVALMIIAREHGPDSKEFQEAKENAKAALARFVHIG